MKKKGHAYKKLVLSFVLIFMIPILMGVGFYFYAYGITEAWVNSANENLFETIRDICDTDFDRYKGILQQIALDREIQQTAALKGKPTGVVQKDLYEQHLEISSQFASLNSGTEYCKDIFIYYKNINKIVSVQGTMNLELYSLLYCAQDEASAQGLKAYLEDYHFYGLANLQNSWYDGSSVVLMTMGVLGANAAESGAMIGIWVDIDSLRSRIDDVFWRDSLSWALVNGAGETIIDPVGAENLDLREAAAGSKTEHTVYFDGDSYILSTVPSEKADLSYVVITPERIISEPAVKLRNFFLGCIFFCMLAGWLLMKQMLRINYDPIKDLLALFTSHDGEEKKPIGDEHGYLREKTSLLLEELKNISQESYQSRKGNRQHYLVRCLNGNWENGGKTAETKQIIEKFADGLNLVCIATFRDTPDKGKQKDSGTKGLGCFIIQNVLSEVIVEHFSVESVIWGEKVFFVIRPNGAAFEEILRERIGFAHEFIFENFGLSLVALAGDIHEGMEGIHLSYLEACEVENFLGVLEDDCTFYREIKDNSVGSYHYSMEMEERILEALRNRNSGLAISLVNRILEITFKEMNAAPEIRRCLIFDLTASILKAAEGMDKSIEEVVVLGEITPMMQYKTIHEKLVDAIEKICAESGEEVYSEGQKLCLKVTEYIRQNYRNPDLNISQTALKFNVTPSHLSKIYKKYTGHSLLKVINQTRIDKAKILLMEGRTVSEVADLTGFRDAPTFARAFKKYEGMTPGQLKNISKK